MRIKNDWPPNIEEIRKVFDPPKGVVFTYGDTIYAPGGETIEPHLMKHEETHERQQGKDPKGWWGKYLKDPQFRLEQELEAYSNQYAYAKVIIRDRNALAKFLFEIARDLAGPIYGNILTHGEAESKIKNRANG